MFGNSWGLYEMTSLSVCSPLCQSTLDSCNEQLLSSYYVPSPGRGAGDVAGKNIEILTSRIAHLLNGAAFDDNPTSS